MAGISAALWLRGFGLDALILEEALLPGGQLHEIHAPIVDYPLAYGVGGAGFAARVLGDARAAKLSILVGSPTTKVSVQGLWAERDDGRIHARTLLVATGLRRRALGVPGELALIGHGISYSANKDRTIYAGRPVVVVGGGTAAVEDALLCAEVGSPVTLIHRSTRFRARTDFLASARKHPAIKIASNAEVKRIVGNDRVEGVQYRVRGSGITRSSCASGGNPAPSFCAGKSASTAKVTFARVPAAPQPRGPSSRRATFARRAGPRSPTPRARAPPPRGRSRVF